VEPQSTQRRQAETVALSWRIQGRPGDEMVVRFYGEIDEHADFSELRRRLRGAVRFDLAEVRRLSSCGVHQWMSFVGESSWAGPRRLPEFSCDRCGARMEFDDLPERYLAFLEDVRDQARS